MRRGLALPLLFVLAFVATLQSHASAVALVGAKIYRSPEFTFHLAAVMQHEIPEASKVIVQWKGR
jgi:hypothetical protein